MPKKIFIMALDRNEKTEIELEVNEHEILFLINLLWKQRRNKYFGYTLIRFYREIKKDADEILQEKLGINVDETVNKHFKSFKGKLGDL